MSSLFVDCLGVCGVHILRCIEGRDLDHFALVLQSLGGTKTLLADLSLWNHLYQLQYRQSMPSTTFSTYLHTSYHAEFMKKHVRIVRGASIDNCWFEFQVLIFPTTPSLMQPQVNTAAGAIHRVYGQYLESELARLQARRGRFPVGSCVLTQHAMGLPHLIHCIGPHRMQSDEMKLKTMKQAYSCALNKAVEMGYRDIGIVPIGMGIAACPIDQAALKTMQLIWQILMTFCKCPQKQERTRGRRFPFDTISIICREDDVWKAFDQAKANCMQYEEEESSDTDEDDEEMM